MYLVTYQEVNMHKKVWQLSREATNGCKTYSEVLDEVTKHMRYRQHNESLQKLTSINYIKVSQRLLCKLIPSRQATTRETAPEPQPFRHYEGPVKKYGS